MNLSPPSLPPDRPAPDRQSPDRQPADRPPPDRPTPDLPVLGATRAQRLALLAGLLVVGWLALQLFASILLPFVVAAGIAYFLDPLASRLARLGLPRGLGAVVLLAALLVFVLLFVLLLYPLFLAQMGMLIARLPTYVTLARSAADALLVSLQDQLGPEFVDERLRALVASQTGAVLAFLVTATTRLIGGGFALFNVLTLLIVTPVVAFYLLRDWPRVIAQVASWLPRRYAAILSSQAREVDRILAAWLRGQAMCSMTLTIFYATMLSAVGLDLALIVGLLAGVLSFIPYVGTITGLVVGLGLAMAQFPTWTGVLLVLGVFVAGNILENYIIYPRFLGDRVELHAVWVIFALFAGGAAFGFLGVLLAVPVAATIGVLCRFWLRRYLESPLYRDPPSEQPPA